MELNLGDFNIWVNLWSPVGLLKAQIIAITSAIPVFYPLESG